MKKALSFILALTLALTLLPTFASAVDMEPAEVQSFTVDFTQVDTEGLTDYPDGNTNYGKRWYIKTGDECKGPNWQVLTTASESNIYELPLTGSNLNQLVQYFSGTPGYLNINYPKNTDLSESNTLAMKITAPAAGNYSLSAYVRKVGSNQGGKAEIIVNEKSLGEIDFNKGTGGTWQTVDFTGTVKLEEGDNILKVVNSMVDITKANTNAFVSFTFTRTEKVVNPNVTFAATTNIPDDTISVQTVARGASVDLTSYMTRAGYEFVGWKRGSNDDNSAWIDIDGDTYNVWTNTFLTAIYKPVGETAAKTVDFWNQNGAYLGTATEATYATDVKRVPSLTGFGTFRGWFTDGNVQLTEDAVLSAGTTNAVAQYDDKVVSGVKREGVEIDGEVVYNKAITFEKENSSSTCWMRDGVTISYDDTYTYNVWDATNVTEGTDTDPEKPVAILEYNAGYGAYMFEYDDCDYEIVEAGIIFGDADATVDSCTKKYTSQRKVSHNQFTVPAESGTAKGYIIWKNASGAYQIDYFSVNQ